MAHIASEEGKVCVENLFAQNPSQVNYSAIPSWEWCYGKSPAFDISHGKRFDWGEVEINLTLQKAIIKEVKIFTDAMDVEMFDWLSSEMQGLPYQKNALAEAVKQNITDETAQKDLVEWIKAW